MTESMVERVARAISVAVLGVDTEWRNSIGLARAAISAMREPTEWMLKRVRHDAYGLALYKSMIDCALAEKPE